MYVLTIKTDQPEACIALYEGPVCQAEQHWQAHRQLAETIHDRIKMVLAAADVGMADLGAIACYQGPGSFTGLRIGLSVGNALAYGLQIPIVATQGEDWTEHAIRLLEQDKGQHVVLPEYGAPVHITAPRK